MMGGFAQRVMRQHAAPETATRQGDAPSIDEALVGRSLAAQEWKHASIGATFRRVMQFRLKFNSMGQVLSVGDGLPYLA
jgi:hypothetical protein